MQLTEQNRPNSGASGASGATDAPLINACDVIAPTTDTPADSPPPHYALRINDTPYTQSVIITPQEVRLWQTPDARSISLNDFQLLADLSRECNSELVLLGLGHPLVLKQTGFPDPALTQPLMQHRIGLESMDTPAACRTYNALISDHRRITAALLL